jgi:hypothetical protein
MRVGLFVVLLFTSACALAKGLVAGVTFYQLTTAGQGERVEYRFSDGVGWRTAKARIKWAERPLYDYRIAPWGAVVIEGRLVRDGKTVSNVTLKIPAHPDTRFDVHSEIGPDDPTRACFGCNRPAASSPIAGNAKERFWVWYGFNGISHTMIF